MLKNLVKIAIVIGLVAGVYWFGYTSGKGTAERDFLGISAMSDTANLLFKLALRDMLVESNYEKALLVLERTIDTKISILNSYSELMFVSGKGKLKQRLRELLEFQKKQGRDTGEIEQLFSKL